MGERVTYLIEIEKARDEGDFEGNGVPAELKPMSPMQLQKAIAYDLVRIRTAELDPFTDVVVKREWQNEPNRVWSSGYNPRAEDNFKPPVSHRPEFG